MLPRSRTKLSEFLGWVFQGEAVGLAGAFCCGPFTMSHRIMTTPKIRRATIALKVLGADKPLQIMSRCPL